MIKSVPDLNILYEKVIAIPPRSQKRNPLVVDLVKMYFVGALLKLGIYQRLLFGNIIQSWFNEFNTFWREYLGGRTIDIIDFHFLRDSYRLTYTSVAQINEKNEAKFLQAWQDPENLHLLFYNVWNSTKVSNLEFYLFLKYLPQNGKILEYGCSTAPIVTGLIRYQSHRDLDFTIADILQISFIYAIYSVGSFENVHHLLLKPFDNTIKQKAYYDTIVCMTVLEHLPNPLEVVKSFHKSLKPGGMFIFDFIKSEGKSLDTVSGLKDRKKVLVFIKDNFEVIYGKIDYDHSMNLTVVKRV